MTRDFMVSALDALTDAQRTYLETGMDPAGAELAAASFKFFTWRHDPELVKATWALVRDEFLMRWAEINPGRRPAIWWELDAPAQRQRVGGCGDPVFQHRNWIPEFLLGIPRYWLPEMHACGIDPNDVPTFEAQAAFLKRHQLFLPGEEERLTPDDFTREAIDLDHVLPA